ncbi:type II toxin-antitoxin system HicA family toxin [Pontibacter diazotrophicus]|uniref:Type II toxin-antitoxin system HicA family toxin n=1 Tax=Pontibacter diazotrophicus TaxID=1400979 RepID=A0A3D8L6W7_9BACT|nr:type II toxin-antitoxin system HicA family toxin [Pontibacter diazotrophicus]RDV13036.1 type II toxin-antitoxin system HicA family toxin [Pontibacter diazotrophicus]
MKRGKFEKHLKAHGCELHRNGSKHDIFRNIATGKKTTIPRHPDIDELLCKEICKQLGIPKP